MLTMYMRAIQQAEIDFCGDTLVKRYLERSGRSILHDKIRAATARDDSNALDVVLREYGTEVNNPLCLKILFFDDLGHALREGDKIEFLRVHMESSAAGKKRWMLMILSVVPAGCDCAC